MRLYSSSDAGKHLALYAFLAPMLYCDSIVDAMNKGLGQQKIAVRYNILTAILDVLFLFILLPKYGMKGYFVSFFITHLLNFLLSLRLLIRSSHITITPKVPIVTILSAIGALLISSGISGHFIRCTAFLAVFISLLTLLGVVSREDLHWLRGLIRRKS